MVLQPIFKKVLCIFHIIYIKILKLKHIKIHLILFLFYLILHVKDIRNWIKLY